MRHTLRVKKKIPIVYRGFAGDAGPDAAGMPAVSPIQRYREQDGYKISENNKFAVKDEGTSNSEMFIRDGETPFSLNNEIVEFVLQPTSGLPAELGMVKVVPDVHLNSQQVEDMHCDTFSRLTTNRKEEVENEIAPPGKNLFAETAWGTPEGLVEGKHRSMWGPHYAPVIVEDAGDRGTIETAVDVPHIWFGIYGQQRGQGFHLKTVLSDIELSFRNKKISEQTRNQLIGIIRQFIRTGAIDQQDYWMAFELKEILEKEGQHPDIDKPFREQEEKEKKETEISGRFEGMLKDSTMQAADIWETINTDKDKDMFVNMFSSYKFIFRNDNLILAKLNDIVALSKS